MQKSIPSYFLRSIRMRTLMFCFFFSTAVFGGLDMHGKNVSTQWTQLASTAAAGDTSVTLTDSVGWQVSS